MAGVESRRPAGSIGGDAQAEGRCLLGAHRGRGPARDGLPQRHRARTAIHGWDSEWHNCVYIDLPFSGQVSWHYHDDHRHLFAGVPPYRLQWDGHDTPTKYRRVSDQRIRNMFTAGINARYPRQ